VSPADPVPYRLHEPLPELDAPVLVGMLTGWIDASAAAASALATLEAACDVRTLATFDGDVFVDYRARRPTMELRDGRNVRLVWPEIELKVGRDPGGHDVVVLSGPEPDTAWRRFGAVATGLALQLGVRSAIFLGAYPFAAPHTRPSRLSCSSPSRELLAGVSFLKSSVDVPAGMGAVLEHAFHDRQVPAIGLWAQVPHYLGAMSYPAAAVALLEGLGEVAGLSVDTTLLRNEATIQRQRVDQLVAANDEHLAMVRQLEAVYDATSAGAGAEASDEGASATGGPLASQPLPNADELAAEIERFLRDQG